MDIYKLKLIADIHYYDIVNFAYISNYKLRLVLFGGSFIDVNMSVIIPGKFGFHWETLNSKKEIFRYDNFPDPKWKNIETYPYHFHNGSQNNVVATPFPQDELNAFHAFMGFVKDKLNRNK